MSRFLTPDSPYLLRMLAVFPVLKPRVPNSGVYRQLGIPKQNDVKNATAAANPEEDTEAIDRSRRAGERECA